MSVRRTTTEVFDEEGRLVERTTVEEDVTPVTIQPAPLPPYRPNDITPYPFPYSPNTWHSPITGGCSACALSGVCNCVNAPGAPRITCAAGS